MIRYLAGLVTSSAALAAGGWLTLAPAALGHEGDPRRIDLLTGAAVCAVGFVTAVAWAAAWRARLRADGVLPQRRAAPADQPATPSAEELHDLLKPLIVALAADQAERAEARA